MQPEWQTLWCRPQLSPDPYRRAVTTPTTLLPCVLLLTRRRTTAHCSLLTVHYLLLTAYCSLLTAHNLLLTAYFYCLLLTAYYLLLTTFTTGGRPCALADSLPAVRTAVGRGGGQYAALTLTLTLTLALTLTLTLTWGAAAG
eukprot:scaffold100453_cov51-Phaeocystis_antarctica.AAC.1